MYQRLANNHLRRSVPPDAADEATQEVFIALMTRDWLSKLVLGPEDSLALADQQSLALASESTGNGRRGCTSYSARQKPVG